MKNKTFVITGASSGLGKAMKDVIIKNSLHRVITLSRKAEDSDEQNERIDFIGCDLSSMANTDFIKNLNPGANSEEVVYVNNAAVIEPLEQIGEMTDSEIIEHLQVNVVSAIVLINALVKRFSETPLSVINISSGASTRPISHWSLYCASKASLEMFCKVLSKENPHVNVRSIDPGVLNTNMQQSIRNSRMTDVENFRSLATDGMLVEPEVAALKILTPYL